jgi:hypothetical protein
VRGTSLNLFSAPAGNPSSIRSISFHFAVRSDLAMEPTLI